MREWLVAQPGLDCNAVGKVDRQQMIPIESPPPIRTPGILWQRDVPQTASAQSFAVIVRKTALGNSRRQDGPG